jgi:hypothetical protein
MPFEGLYSSDSRPFVERRAIALAPHSSPKMEFGSAIYCSFKILSTPVKNLIFSLEI